MDITYNIAVGYSSGQIYYYLFSRVSWKDRIMNKELQFCWVAVRKDIKGISGQSLIFSFGDILKENIFFSTKNTYPIFVLFFFFFLWWWWWCIFYPYFISDLAIIIISSGTIQRFRVRIPDSIPIMFSTLHSDHKDSQAPHALLQKAFSAKRNRPNINIDLSSIFTYFNVMLFLYAKIHILT